MVSDPSETTAKHKTLETRGMQWRMMIVPFSAKPQSWMYCAKLNLRTAAHSLCAPAICAQQKNYTCSRRWCAWNPTPAQHAVSSESSRAARSCFFTAAKTQLSIHFHKPMEVASKPKETRRILTSTHNFSPPLDQVPPHQSLQNREF